MARLVSIEGLIFVLIVLEYTADYSYVILGKGFNILVQDHVIQVADQSDLTLTDEEDITDLITLSEQLIVHSQVEGLQLVDYLRVKENVTVAEEGNCIEDHLMCLLHDFNLQVHWNLCQKFLTGFKFL